MRIILSFSHIVLLCICAYSLGQPGVPVSSNYIEKIKILKSKLSSVGTGDKTSAGEIIKELDKEITELARNIDLSVNSGDLANAGRGVATELKEAILGLSENWNLAVNSADLKDVGSAAALHLSNALQNINAHLTLKLDVGEGVITSIGYISIAVGVAFSLLFVAIIICVAHKNSCFKNVPQFFSRRQTGELFSFPGSTASDKNLDVQFSTSQCTQTIQMKTYFKKDNILETNDSNFQKRFDDLTSKMLLGDDSRTYLQKAGFTANPGTLIVMHSVQNETN